MLVPLLRGETVTTKTDWFELRRRAAAADALFAAQRRDRGGQPGLPDRRARGRQARPGPALARRDLRPAASTRWRPTGRSPRTAPRTAGTDRGPRAAGGWSGRCTSPRPASRRAPTSRFGLEKWLYYFREIAALPLAPDADGDPVDAMIDTGLAVIGTPDDAIAQIERLEDQSGRLRRLPAHGPQLGRLRGRRSAPTSCSPATSCRTSRA